MGTLLQAVNFVAGMGPMKQVLLAIAYRTASEVLVQAPLDIKDGVPSALLVLVPGALLSPKDYAALLKALQETQGIELNLWVASPPISWLSLFLLGFNAHASWAEHSDSQIMRAVAAARAAEFPLLGNPQGRMENVFVAMHSLSAAFYDSVPMKHCAGSIMLGAVLDGSISRAATAASAPRSLMHICGQLDGQARMPRAAWAAAAATQLARQLSLRRFATICPFAIIPGCNHAQFSNGVVNKQRGDVASDEPIENVAAAIADLIAAFVAANHPGATPKCSSPAVDRLASATAACFKLLTPFSAAAGRGSPSDALEGGTSPDGCTATFAYGAERLPAAQATGGPIMHPGEMTVAEQVAREALRSMLALGMAAGASEGVRVAVTVHQHLDSFIYSQPTAFKSETASGAEEWVVMCHVHLGWECYRPGFASLRKPLSPFYSLKLRQGAAVMQDMGLEGGREGVVTGADINARNWEQALASAPQLFLDTFHKRGKPLLFSPDRDMTPGMRSPLEWVNAPPSLVAVEGGIALQMPCISTPLGGSQAIGAQKAPGPGSRRGNGANYIKCVSPAWMHEWIMIEGLRH